MPEHTLHRIEKVAERFGISVRQVHRLVDSKELGSLKIGKRRLVSEEAIAKFIKKKESEQR